MTSRIVTATVQAAVLSGTSNVLAQVITAYRDDTSIKLNLTPIVHFVLFTILNCPPNCVWQELMEDWFPSRKKVPQLKEKVDGEVVISGREESTERLDVGNTIKKLLLDQTVGATANTVCFIAIMAALKGKGYDETVEIIKLDFWPMMIAGLKVWPIVSLLCFSIVPVDKRMLVFSFAGLCWGIYVSLLVAG